MIRRVSSEQTAASSGKSGLANVVQCGGTLGQACFPGWGAADPPSVCSGAFGRASETRLSWRVAPNTLPRRCGVFFYVILEALGGAHHEHQEQL